jgi:membrane associated rhomboid family serine protease
MYKAAQIPFFISFALIIVFALGEITDVDLSPLGILPRDSEGFLGIFTAYFVHANIEHLLSNVFSFFFLATAMFWFYPQTAPKVLTYGYWLTGLLVWIFARPSVHIGASGLVYVLASFLIFSGFFRKSYGSIVISAAIFLMHGGMIVGIFPQGNNVSWESHLAGFLLGLLFAYIWRNENDFEEPQKRNPYDPYFPYQRGYRNWEGKDYHYVFREKGKR